MAVDGKRSRGGSWSILGASEEEWRPSGEEDAVGMSARTEIKVNGKEMVAEHIKEATLLQNQTSDCALTLAEIQVGGIG